MGKVGQTIILLLVTIVISDAQHYLRRGGMTGQANSFRNIRRNQQPGEPPQIPEALRLKMGLKTWSRQVGEHKVYQMAVVKRQERFIKVSTSTQRQPVGLDDTITQITFPAGQTADMWIRSQKGCFKVDAGGMALEPTANDVDQRDRTHLNGTLETKTFTASPMGRKGRRGLFCQNLDLFNTAGGPDLGILSFLDNKPKPSSQNVVKALTLDYIAEITLPATPGTSG